MNWNIGLLLCLLLVPVWEIPRLRRLRSARDMMTFFLVWVLAVAAVLADIAEWPYLRPLDWIKLLVEIPGKLIS
ncbi:hypothetical protein J7E73_11250 [Paenibacillus albidus]|uniref:hypothetical protein n=1 Tax=Paenibacillus albidus TaxID=2041023 RepID=UPI001BE6086E|nr:hypothetical protein [Paenibacillus albidus]MBT2289701.1 hypothetical protein [Paenibacillus albidus]